MKKYNLLNVTVGWISFVIALVTYTLTLEPTASFWDCGEFISASYRLQVVHPPGAPLFLMIGRLFSMLAGSDTAAVAHWVNMVSAVTSALTVLFSFWTITHLAKKILVKNAEEVTDTQLFTILGAGIVGALSLTFSDTFWFSAVEAEVYASSCFFTAITFWAILKWENVANEKYADRWLVLIGYIIGLAIGVHLLNLLVIPAIVYVYYFKKFNATSIGVIKASLFAFGAIAIVQFMIIPGLPSLAASFDLFMVNGLGLPFGSGVLLCALLVTGLLTFLIIFTQKRKKVNMNTAVLVFSFIVIGYSSYAMIVIRSLADPPLDMNNPENPFNFISYINREQYGDRPLLYGQYFTAQYVATKEGAMQYRQGKETYEEAGPKIEPVWDAKHMSIFPRMWSNRADHVDAYRQWENIPKPKEGQEEKRPSFGKNLDFLFSYQLNFMYWRYFFWNVIGRQNDEQGHGELVSGNWESGIPFIDKARLGPRENLPHDMATNKGRNHYYALPLILGILGLIYHYRKAREDAFVITLLFLFTGVFIIIYLNFPPLQPRERDYAYVGSYQTFFIWVGLGVLFLADWMGKAINKMGASLVAILIGLVASPYLMAKENWDDHDRSDRYTALDFAKDYLNSCDKNAVLFTNGDNDTYPLWYAQNVEGIRTDIRVINLSLLNTDWYADGLKKQAYESAPVPFTLKPEQYAMGIRDMVVFYDNKGLGLNQNAYYPLKDIIDFVANDNDPRTKVQSNNGEDMSYYPTHNFFIPTDREKVLSNGTVKPKDAGLIIDSLTFTVGRNNMLKNDLITLDFIATNNWDRPVYFAITTGSEAYLGLEPYFQLEGLTYRLVPIRTPVGGDREIGHINSDVMYDNLMNKFKWGNMDKDGIYLDETILRQTKNMRNLFYRLAKTLVEEGQKDKAIKVLDHCLEVMPDKNVPYDVFIVRIVEAYYLAGAKDKAGKLAKLLATRYKERFEYFSSFKGTKNYRQVDNMVRDSYQILGYCQQVTSGYGDKATADEIQKMMSGLQAPM